MTPEEAVKSVELDLKELQVAGFRYSSTDYRSEYEASVASSEVVIAVGSEQLQKLCRIYFEEHTYQNVWVLTRRDYGLEGMDPDDLRFGTFEEAWQGLRDWLRDGGSS